MILKNSEEKRSTLWRTVMAVSSVLIIIIAAFFIIKLFTANPLEGKWVSEDSGAAMEVQSGGTLVITGSESAGEQQSITLGYSVNTETKTFVVQMNEEEVPAEDGDTEAAEAGEDLYHLADSLTGTYEYSIEQNRLTLTELEYGEQMVFVKE